MTRIKKHLLTALLLTMTTALHAQIKGNGNITQRVFDFSGIEVLDFQVTVEGVVDLSYDNDLYLEVDENIFEHLTIKMVGKRLVIDQKKWVEPTQSIRIKLGASQLKRIRNTAWGNLLIQGMDQERFQADMNVGTLTLKGKVDLLDVKTGAGRIDASQLEAKTVSAKINENGKIMVNASEKITFGGKGFGSLVHTGTAKVDQTGSDELQVLTMDEEILRSENAKALAYVQVKLKNNTAKRRQLRFRGPVEKPFGYGAPINAKATKHESFPVGTRVYEDSPLGKDKLLLIITEENAGQVLNLFADK